MRNFTSMTTVESRIALVVSVPAVRWVPNPATAVASSTPDTRVPIAASRRIRVVIRHRRIGPVTFDSWLSRTDLVPQWASAPRGKS
ncbi:hypothetical protein GCM10010532_103970 [Dactylosporangium siamense]